MGLGKFTGNRGEERERRTARKRTFAITFGRKGHRKFLSAFGHTASRYKNCDVINDLGTVDILKLTVTLETRENLRGSGRTREREREREKERKKLSDLNIQSFKRIPELLRHS